MKYAFVSLALSSLMLTSCALGVGAGLGAIAGVAAVQEGGVAEAGSDARIQAEINSLWFQYDVETFRKLDLTINQGRVLITGVVQNPEARVEAVRLAWQPTGVKNVINEIKVADSEGIVGFAKDTWITTRLRSAILIDRDIESLNYSIDTVQGTVYLMGFAQDQRELDLVIQKARTIENVRQVVSYVKLVGAPQDPQGQPPSWDKGYNQDYGSQGQADPSFSNQESGGYGQSYDSYQGQQGGVSGGAPVAPVASGEPISWGDQPDQTIDPAPASVEGQQESIYR